MRALVSVSVTKSGECYFECITRFGSIYIHARARSCDFPEPASQLPPLPMSKAVKIIFGSRRTKKVTTAKLNRTGRQITEERSKHQRLLAGKRGVNLLGRIHL